MKRVDGSSDGHADSDAGWGEASAAGLAYEPLIGTQAPHAPAPVEAVTSDADDGASGLSRAATLASTAEGIAIGEPAGDVLGRPISVGDTIKIGDVGGDGFGGDIIWIDDTVIGTGWYDGGSYDYSYSGQWTTAVGDINGDGLEDALVATYAWDEGGNYAASSSIVIGGSAESTQLTENGQAVYGWAVSAAGDVNGDGCDDLLITTYDYSSGASSAYVVFGAADGLGSGLDLATLDGSNGFKVATGGDGTYSYVSAAGDVNGDGFADLSVSLYDYASGIYADYVVYGAAGAEVQAQLVAILGDYPLGSA